MLIQWWRFELVNTCICKHYGMQPKIVLLRSETTKEEVGLMVTIHLLVPFLNYASSIVPNTKRIHSSFILSQTAQCRIRDRDWIKSLRQYIQFLWFIYEWICRKIENGRGETKDKDSKQNCGNRISALFSVYITTEWLLIYIFFFLRRKRYIFLTYLFHLFPFFLTRLILIRKEKAKIKKQNEGDILMKWFFKQIKWHLFSLNSKYLAACLKSSSVIPVSHEPSDPSNYRPINLILISLAKF